MRYQLNIDSRLKLPEEVYSKAWDIPKYIAVSGEINDESAKKFRDDLSMAEDSAYDAKQKIIPITIDTNGGCVYSLLSMVDAIQNCSLPVATIVEAKAFSAGVILFSCGVEGHRYMSQNATLMIHSAGASYLGGKANDLKADVKELERLNENIYKIMSKNCGKPENYFIDKIEKKHVDWYLDPPAAVKENLANHIHIPSINVQVTMSHTFE